MATVIGVRFKKAGKVYYFDPNGLWPKPGENVVVETASPYSTPRAVSTTTFSPGFGHRPFGSK